MHKSSYSHLTFVLDWLDASSNCKDSRRALGQTAKSFAKLFSRRGTQSQAKLLADLEHIHIDCLRKARVRLDCLCMCLFRLFWASLDVSNVNIFLWADGSPQWRGLELFAVSADFFFGSGDIVRKLLPCVSLPKWMADSMSKAVALLWQIFLMVGPTFYQVRAFCSRVRSFTTDMGAERLIAGIADFLPDFYELWLNCKCPAGINRDLKSLFPRAIQIGGWKHLFDNLIVRGLSSLFFFPGWLTKTKAVVAWLRTFTVIDELCVQFIAKGQLYISCSFFMCIRKCLRGWGGVGWGGQWGFLQKMRQCTKIIIFLFGGGVG